MMGSENVLRTILLAYRFEKGVALDTCRLLDSLFHTKSDARYIFFGALKNKVIVLAKIP